MAATAASPTRARASPARDRRRRQGPAEHGREGD
ncbi:MAG: hypothetical protein WKG07_21195 [Hymenobacter sp.]